MADQKMVSSSRKSLKADGLRLIFLATAALLGLGSLTGCVVVGASSRGGFFIWPGGVGLVVLILIVLLVLRRR